MEATIERGESLLLSVMLLILEENNEDYEVRWLRIVSGGMLSACDQGHCQERRVSRLVHSALCPAVEKSMADREARFVSLLEVVRDKQRGLNLRPNKRATMWLGPPENIPTATT